MRYYKALRLPKTSATKDSPSCQCATGSIKVQQIKQFWNNWGSQETGAKTARVREAKFYAQNYYADKSCWQMLHDIIQALGLSKPHFCNLTGLDEVYYRRAETNPDTKPSKRAIVAVACGLDIDLDTTNKLLQLAGHAFEDSDEDNALKFCITGFVGQPIDEANEFLSSYGYAPLGTQQRK